MSPFSNRVEQCNPWADRWHAGFRGPIGAFVSFPLDNPARTFSEGGYTVFDAEVGLATNETSAPWSPTGSPDIVSSDAAKHTTSLSHWR